MARKQRYDKQDRKKTARRPPGRSPEQEETAVEGTSVEAVKEGPVKGSHMPYLVLFLFGFLLYANTIPFDYVLDDKLYITANAFTKKGFEGISDHWTNDLMTGFFGRKKNLVEGGRYRPLALTTHAIEWELFGNHPHVSHFVNIVLYGLIGVVLFSVLRRVFPTDRKKWWWTLPFVAAALFIAHPLHTEVGANIKSRDELMSTLFALLAFRSVWSFLEKGEKRTLALSALWFALSLTSKESSVVFLGVVPLTMVFFSRAPVRQGIVSLAPMAGVLLAYIGLRAYVYADQGGSIEVAKELMNKPYMLASAAEHYASIFFTMGLYLKLLFWPHPLTHDYYPFHPFRTYAELEAGLSPYVDWSEPFVLLSLAMYLALAAYGLYALVQRIRTKKRDVAGYGVLVFLGTFLLYSNLLFDIGAFMNERFMFVPSLGFCIAIAWLFVEKAGSKRAAQPLAMAFLAMALLGYSVKTMTRNYAWESDYALASADVGTSDGSAKVKMTMGSELLNKAQEESDPAAKAALLDQAERYCKQSLEIYPEYFPPLDILGNIYFEKKNYEFSVYYFQQAVKRKGNDQRLVRNLEAVGNVATQNGEFKAAVAAYKTAGQFFKGKDRSRVYSALGEVYGKDLHQPEKALKYLRKAQRADPENPGAYQKIGIIKAMGNQPDSAMLYFQQALEKDPENARVLLNIGILYRQQGNNALGDQYIQKAMQLDPSLKPGGG